MALEHLQIGVGERVLNLNADDGALGLALAAAHPEACFLLFDYDLRSRALSGRNLEANYEIQNVDLIDDLALLSIKNVDTVVICPKRFDSRDQIISQLAFAKGKLRSGGILYLVSHTKAGAKTLQGELARVFAGKIEVVGRGRGGYRVFAATKTGELVAEPPIRRIIHFEVLDHSFDLATEPSLFSKDTLDEGTRALLENVDLSGFRELLDVGCGWGAIGIVAATVNPEGKAVMVDVDTRATNTAHDNVRQAGLDQRVDVLATENIASLEQEFDLVLSNPPFHTNTRELIDMFKAAKKRMAKGADLYVVVEQSYLKKMQGVLEIAFGNVKIYKKVEGKNNFYILAARK